MASLTAPRHGSDDVVLYEGEVEKRGQVIRNWRPRYMVLWRNGPRLQYFMRDAAGAWAARDDISLANILFCKPAKGHCVFKLCASGVVIYFRTKSQSICETWIRAIVSVVAAQASASSLARLQPFDGGLSTLTRSASMNAAITKLNMRASSGHPALVRRGSMFKADNPLKAVVDSGRPSLKTHGMLHLTIVCATDLIGKDRSGTSDPYCRINYDGYVVETGVQAATLNPAWNQTFDLPFHRSITHCIIDVFDRDELSKDDFLGRAVVSLAAISLEPQTLWVPLGKRSIKSHVAGKLCVQLHTDISPDVSVQTAVGAAQCLSCMQVQCSTSGGSTLIPDPSSEHASHAIAVNMFPYLPTNAAAEKVLIKGVLMITNQRVMFVVDGHLENSDAASSVGPSVASPVDAADTEFVPEDGVLGGSASLISTSGMSAFDEESEDDQGDSLMVSEQSVDIGLYGIDAAPPASAAEAPASSVGGLLETFDADVETFVVQDAPQEKAEEVAGFQIPLASIVGVLRYDRLGGMSGCGTLESAASPGMTSSVWEFARGQPALQIDTDGFRSPVFVLIPDDNIFRKQSTASSMFEDASADVLVHVNKSVQCGVVFDFLSHAVLNRHLAPHITASLLPALSRPLPDGSNVAPAPCDNLLVRELRRQGLPNAVWRLSDSNEAYTLCDSYPSVLAVPVTVNDDCLRSASSFRSKARVPALTWVHPANHACITRCSQPMVGLAGHRNSYDETLVEAIRNATPHPSGVIVIVDCRPKLNAVANQTQGKGYESVGPGSNYPNARLHFMGIANIHAMRKSLETLRSAALRAPEQSVVDTDYVTSTTEDGPDAPADAPSSAPSAWGKLTGMFALPWVSASAAAASQLPPPPVMSSSSHVEDGENNEGSDAGETPLQAVSGLSFGHIGDDSAWHAHVAESAWLNHCAAVLCAASRVSTVVNRDAVSVLVHCSDGWDRTAQVCALAQLLLDPYYRTIDGFSVLVEKDWVAFGHKFKDRLGFDAAGGFASSERSPVFVQFLDCVRLIMAQHPTRFEFNIDFLLFIAEATATGWFRTFACNTECEVTLDAAVQRLPQVWAAIEHLRHQFVNEEYVPMPPAALGPIRVAGVSGSMRQRREWHSAGVLCIQHSPRQLSVWREYICSWELSLDALFSSVRGCTCFRSPMGCAYCHRDGDASRSIQRAGRSSRSVFQSGPVDSAARSIASGNSGTHGGLTRGFGLGPRSGASHCAVCSAEFMRLIRPRKHCAACKRSVCKSCSAKVGVAAFGISLPDVKAGIVRICKPCASKTSKRRK